MVARADRATAVAPRARWANIVVRAVFSIVLFVCLAQAVRQGAGAWFARKNTFESIHRAEIFDPANPEYPAQSAHLLAAKVESADARGMVRDLENATRRGPRRAIHWANLGESYEITGRIADAARVYQRAVDLFPKSPEINWQFANFLVRQGNAPAATAPLREAILGDPGLRIGAFDVAWRAGFVPSQIMEIIPDRQDILSAYLDYLVQTKRFDAAAEVWKRLMATPEPFDLDAAFRYFDALWLARRVEELPAIWAGLAHHDPAKIHSHAGDANLIEDGGFEEPILGGGFGWRTTTIEGAAISFDSRIAHSGTRSLAIRFDGKRNLEFANVVQLVAVEPLHTYRFLAYMRTNGITTDTGPRIAVYDPLNRNALSLETENLLGTSGWEEHRLDFTTGPGTRLVVIQIIRPPSRKLDNQIAGTLWLDDVSLIAVP
jgi:hypothetical protein